VAVEGQPLRLPRRADRNAPVTEKQFAARRKLMQEKSMPCIQGTF
jgi:hypothetical protein